MDDFKKLIEKSHEDHAKADGDYYGPDGLLRCGSCNTVKEQIILVDDGQGGRTELRPYIPCACRQSALDKIKAHEAERKRQEDQLALFRASELPGDYREATFEVYKKTPDNAAVFEMAKNYADEFEWMFKSGKGLLLHGNFGTGKTYAAACIANQLMRQGRGVFFTPSYSMTKLREQNREEEFVRKIMTSSLLIIDDLGAERDNSFASERILDYIDSRCNTKRPMIVTTNLEFDRMLKPETKNEGRVFDRILKRCFPIACTGESWRRAEARDNFTEMKAILRGGRKVNGI